MDQRQEAGSRTGHGGPAANEASALRHTRPSEPLPTSGLGRREKQVLCLVAAGRRSAEIALDLGISEATVKTHRRNIKRKLQIHSTGELTRYAVREGLIAL